MIQRIIEQPWAFFGLVVTLMLLYLGAIIRIKRDNERKARANVDRRKSPRVEPERRWSPRKKPL